MIFCICWLVTTLTALVLYYRHVYTRFSRNGVKGFVPLPLLGNMGRVMLRIDHMSENVEKTYKAFPNERFVGKYDFTMPVVMIRDLELVKKITIKDFEYFLDHRSMIDDSVDPFFGRNLFALKGQEWKDMRSTLSPAFTSSKIRLMVPFMIEAGDQMIKSIKKKNQLTGVDYIDIDAKDLLSRYANDVIASCAFGLKVDSHKDQDQQFFEMGKKTAVFTFRQLFILFAFASFPKLMKLFKVSMFAKASKVFFKNLVLSMMKERETRNIIRPDMIHLLMEAKKGKLSYDEKIIHDTDAGYATVEESAVGRKKINRAWEDIDLIDQAVGFFIAGFEATSSIMPFLLYELAVNPDVQEKLYQEIQEYDVKKDGKIDYTSIQQMTYMDMVVSELLRLWPGPMMERLCIKNYNIGRPNNEAVEDFVVRKGESIHIPLWGIHRDPNHFLNPDKFNPERFSEQNKHNIKPFTYMPFGLGPRNCIGSRFALCEMKVMVYQLLQAVELSPCEKTPIPAKLSTEIINLRLKGGHILRFKMRK